MKAEDIIKALDLAPHPEGGYYRETYRSDLHLPASALPRHDGPRAASTAIYYLLTADSFSAMHRVASDELFHFYAGDAVEMLQLHPDGRGEQFTIGANLLNGERPQICVPAGTWQGCRLAPGGRFALMGCTVAPGFDFADFTMARRDDLLAEYPHWRNLICVLTREN
jgi:predicted cupin superfamily sugar epimerase